MRVQLKWVILNWILLALEPAQPTSAQIQPDGSQKQLVIEDPLQLIGKRINVGRLPLCEPGTYKPDLAHSGMTATVVSARPSNTISVSKSAMDKLAPEAREIILDQQRAALLLLQFQDGVQLDTCAPIGPKKLAESIALAPGEVINSAPATGVAGDNPPTAIDAVDRLSDEEVNSAVKGNGENHWLEIDDAGLLATQGAQVPSITLLMPEALIAIRSQSAKKQFLQYEPTDEDRQRALAIFARGFVSNTIQGGCQSTQQATISG